MILQSIVAFDVTPAMHVRTVDTFLPCLRKYDLDLSPPTFGMTRPTLLGDTVSPDGVRPNANKVAALTDMSMPTMVKQLALPWEDSASTAALSNI